MLFNELISKIYLNILIRKNRILLFFLLLTILAFFSYNIIVFADPQNGGMPGVPP